jgi:hypothetical protein
MKQFKMALMAIITIFCVTTVTAEIRYCKTPAHCGVSMPYEM